MNKRGENGSSSLRLTRQRRVILGEFRTPGVHLTPDMVYDRVRRKVPNISLSTVYRNLEILSQQGLIKKIGVTGTQQCYDGGLHRHYHVRCTVCGKVSDISAKPFGDLDSVARTASNFKILGHELEFQGLCRKCKNNKNSRNSNQSTRRSQWNSKAARRKRT
ncbi:MAG: transcriptional repressor [Planctomycetota bacterium]|nr:transcriptional repressor [Planctomycetota bacterium]